MYRRFCALSALLTVLLLGSGCGGGSTITPPPALPFPGPVALPAPSAPPAMGGVLRQLFSVDEEPHPIPGMRYSKFVPAFVGYMNFPKNAGFIQPDGSVAYDNTYGDQVVMQWDNTLGAFYNYQSPSTATRGGLLAPFPKLYFKVNRTGWSWGGDGGDSESGYVNSQATISRGPVTDPLKVEETIRVKDVAPTGWNYHFTLDVGRQGQLLVLATKEKEKGHFYIGTLVPEYNTSR
jgi:hypothetical protein